MLNLKFKKRTGVLHNITKFEIKTHIILHQRMYQIYNCRWKIF